MPVQAAVNGYAVLRFAQGAYAFDHVRGRTNVFICRLVVSQDTKGATATARAATMSDRIERSMAVPNCKA